MDALLVPAVAATLFAAVLVQSTFGFGLALTAMSILATFLDLRTAAPVVALTGFTASLVLLTRLWRSIDFRAGSRLVLGAAMGMPFGTLALRVAPEPAVRAVLGALLIGLGLTSLVTTRLPRLEHRAWVYGFGFVGGVLGGAFTFIGPPVVIYGAMKRWPPEQFRATLQGYFLPASALVCTSHFVSGLWTRQVLQLYAAGVLPVLGGIVLGRYIARWMPPGRFDRLLYAAIIVFGAMLVW